METNKGTQKAMKFLGRDSSREKVMNTLGIEGDELEQAEQARLEREEEKLERQRQTTSLNKKDCIKALEVLGIDPSKEKIKDRLGIDEEVIQEAKMELIAREEEKYVRKRRNSAGSNKRNALKALDVLGVDPSKDKVMNTLGMDEKDVEVVEKEKVEIYEQECSRKRSNSWLNKKDAAKAMKVLGVEPSRNKVMETLGIVELDLKEAEEQTLERKEEITNNIIHKRITKNKKANKKALKILGYDPSDIKLQNILGIDLPYISNQSQIGCGYVLQNIALAIGLPLTLTTFHFVISQLFSL